MNLKELALAGNLATNAGELKATTVPWERYALEPKLDGWRILAEVCEGHVNLYSRAGNNYRGQLPAIEAALLERFPAGTWLDGEAVSIAYLEGGKVKSQWKHAQSALTKGGVNLAAAKITYMVFDLIAHRGIDARALPYANRRKLLEQIFEGDWPAGTHVELVEQFPASLERHEKLVAMGYEGSVLKSLSGPYASGKRGHGWIKIKASATEDVVIMGFEDGTDVGAVVFGQFQSGKLVRRGTCKRKPDLIPTPDLMEWAGRVAEVKHNGKLASGALRNPRMLRVRDDKPAQDCAWS